MKSICMPRLFRLFSIVLIIFLFHACADSNKQRESNNEAELSNTQPGPLMIADIVRTLDETEAAVIPDAIDTDKMFNTRSYILHVNSYRMFTYEYLSNNEFEEIFISDSGHLVGTTSMSATVDWAGSPHFYRQENILLLYVGCEGLLLRLLESTLGEPFAGGDCYFIDELNKSENALTNAIAQNDETLQTVLSYFDMAEMFESKGAHVEIESRYFDITLETYARLLSIDGHRLRIYEYQSLDELTQLHISPCANYLGMKDNIRHLTWGSAGRGAPFFYLYGNLLILYAERYIKNREAFIQLLEETLGLPFAGEHAAVPSCVPSYQ